MLKSKPDSELRLGFLWCSGVQAPGAEIACEGQGIAFRDSLCLPSRPRSSAGAAHQGQLPLRDSSKTAASTFEEKELTDSGADEVEPAINEMTKPVR